MALKGLNSYLFFDLEQFLEKKRLVFLKTATWLEDDKTVGTKVIVQIIEDNTPYLKPDITNFGEQLTIKVRGLAPSAFDKLKPLATEVLITDVERASIYGEYRNQLSIIASVSAKGA